LNTKNKKQTILLNALILGVIFTLYQIYGIYQENNAFTLPRHQELTNLLIAQLKLNPKAIAFLCYYSLLYIASNIALIVVGAILAYEFSKVIKLHLNLSESPSLIWYVLFASAWICLLALLNNFLNPLSNVFSNADLLLIEGWRGKVIISAIILLAALPAVIGMTSILTRLAITHGRIFLLILFPALCLFYLQELFMSTAVKKQGSLTDKNVILIGIDSLRPDFIPAIKQANSEGLLSKIIEQGVTFTDTTTPLARTFPSYMSILTGKYPINHGARFNLYPRNEFFPVHTIAGELKSQGYNTIYATDESRFANFSYEFGFQEILTPPQGALDFILGTALDSIGTNLLLESQLTSWMIPHLNANRAAYKTYKPAIFSKKIENLVSNIDKNRPIFLTVHFCLPHWPYSMSTTESTKLSTQHNLFSSKNKLALNYMSSVLKADKQVSKLFEQLKLNGFLQNAVVVVLSDHGESLGLDKDVLHGSDLHGGEYRGFSHGGFGLAKEQFSVVLSIQSYSNGKPEFLHHNNIYPASLVDVTPTIIDLLGKNTRTLAPDGRSLKTQMMQIDAITNRVRYIETGLSGPLVEKSDIDEKAVLGEFASLYKILPDLRLEVATKLLPGRLAIKQRGAYIGNTGLLTWQSEFKKCWLYSNFNNMTAKCVAEPWKYQNTKFLYQATCSHFKKDLDFSKTWCSKPIAIK
jgi:Sulfatase